jgi:hypothetical protein
MLETVDPMLLFGVAGFIGGGIRGAITVLTDDKKGFDWAIASDTAIKGIATGIAFSFGLAMNLATLGVVALAGAGVDTYFNKLGISMMPALRDAAANYKKKK